MLLKWKPQHVLRFPFPLSLVYILGIEKFHTSTSTSTIILKIQIKKYFLFFSIFSHFLGNQTVQQIQRNVISSIAWWILTPSKPRMWFSLWRGSSARATPHQHVLVLQRLNQLADLSPNPNTESDLRLEVQNWNVAVIVSERILYWK